MRVTANLKSSTGDHESMDAHGAGGGNGKEIKRSQVAPEPPEGHDHGHGHGHGHKRSKHARFFEDRATDHKVCVSLSHSVSVYVKYIPFSSLCVYTWPG